MRTREQRMLSRWRASSLRATSFPTPRAAIPSRRARLQTSQYVARKREYLTTALTSTLTSYLTSRALALDAASAADAASTVAAAIGVLLVLVTAFNVAPVLYSASSALRNETFEVISHLQPSRPAERAFESPMHRQCAYFYDPTAWTCQGGAACHGGPATDSQWSKLIQVT